MWKLILTATALAATLAYAQSSERPAFEVASVKQAPADAGFGWSTAHGNLTAFGVSLIDLLSRACDLPTLLISGPDWLSSTKYGIAAKGAPSATEAQVMPMLQRLLEERLNLRYHLVPRDMPVYFLAVAKSGLKIRPLDQNPAPFPPYPSGGHSLMSLSGTMATLASRLSRPAERPVLDKTGIQGAFRFRIWYDRGSESDGPDLFQALGQQLGLRLEAGRATVEVFVIDHIDPTPTAN